MWICFFCCCQCSNSLVHQICINDFQGFVDQESHSWLFDSFSVQEPTVNGAVFFLQLNLFWFLNSTDDATLPSVSLLHFTFIFTTCTCQLSTWTSFFPIFFISDGPSLWPSMCPWIYHDHRWIALESQYGQVQPRFQAPSISPQLRRNVAVKASQPFDEKNFD